ncbi:MAG: hypothetical protein JWQ73_3506 [Variovorax sp.]|nr:hypothetical protein [Variovorax sp.]
MIAGALCLAAGMAAAQIQAGPIPASSGIFSCKDSHGRTVTADRPIAECLGTGQQELNPSGTVRRSVGPSYSTKEQELREERTRQAGLVKAAQAEERRRERALLSRYPTAQSHGRERVEALSQIDSIVHAARLHLERLGLERHRLDNELEFYGNDVQKAPASLRLQLTENIQSVAAQARFIEQQEEDRSRVNTRFEQEHLRLVQLWGPPSP